MKRGSIIKRRMAGDLMHCPKLGRLIGAKRSFYHTGIYIGKRKVIHFAGESPWDSDACVEEVTILGFSQGYRVYVLAEPLDRRHGCLVCDEAKRILKAGRRSHKTYSLISNNCQDFTRQCYEVEFIEDGLKWYVPAPPTQRDHILAVERFIPTTILKATGR